MSGCAGPKSQAEAAAELYESVDHAREAVNCYMAGEAGESFTELSRFGCMFVWVLV